jgi:hypothetical protein
VFSSINNLDVVLEHIPNIDVVATSMAAVDNVSYYIADVASVATNMAEVLAADTNAAITTQKALEAAQSASDAADNEDLSKRWANENEDVIVEDGEYSAKHYLAKTTEVRNSLHTLSVETGNYDSQVTYNSITNTLVVPRGAQGAAPQIELSYNEVTGDLEYSILGYISTETQLIDTEEW